MVKKTEEDEEEFEELEDDEEIEDEEEEEAPEIEPPKKKGKKPKREIRNDNWFMQRFPEILRIVDPKNKKVIAEATTMEDIILQLSIISAQNSAEAAKNTR